MRLPSPFLRSTRALALVLALPGCGPDGGAPVDGGGEDAPVDGGREDAPVDGGHEDVPTRIGEPVTILTWNLDDFFDTFDDPASTAVSDAISPQEYGERIAGVAAIIAELEPDVVVLQEVEAEAILSDLDVALGGSYPERRLVPGNDPRGVDLAALSRIPFTDVVSHVTDTFVVEGTVAPEYAYTRDCVEYHFRVGAQDVALLAVHLRGREFDDPDQRLAEAQHTRAIADDLIASDPALAVLVVGDYNDVPGSPPVDAVVGSDPAFTSAADHVEQGSRWTIDFGGSLQLVDHQIGNPTMTSGLDPASVSIRHGGDVDVASDHSPLVATYYLE